MTLAFEMGEPWASRWQAMYVKMSWNEVCLVLELLDREVAQIEASASREELLSGVHPLASRWRELERLRHRLREYECDVRA
ncbi:MAG TPA: hypothetical protein ENJ16_02310 [Planctomycetaceae bacterium]|nr:hypothetical protein [Planctomycetaceae bacterium]